MGSQCNSSQKSQHYGGGLGSGGDDDDDDDNNNNNNNNNIDCTVMMFHYPNCQPFLCLLLINHGMLCIFLTQILPSN